LNGEEVAELRAANLTDAEIADIAASVTRKSAKKVKAKSALKDLLAEKQDWLLEQSAGKPLFSAYVACEMICGAGLYPRPITANGFGDQLGENGWKLPHIKLGKIHRDINYIGKSQEEKDARQAKLDEMMTTKAGRAVLKALSAVLPDQQGESTKTAD